MCWVCEENDGEMAYCQDCGCMICFDVKGGDDVISPAGVTASGDLYCRYHAMEHDLEEYLDEWDE